MKMNKLTGEKWSTAKIKRVHGRYVEVRYIDVSEPDYGIAYDSDYCIWEKAHGNSGAKLLRLDGSVVSIDSPSQVTLIGKAFKDFVGTHCW